MRPSAQARHFLTSLALSAVADHTGLPQEMPAFGFHPLHARPSSLRACPSGQNCPGNVLSLQAGRASPSLRSRAGWGAFRRQRSAESARHALPSQPGGLTAAGPLASFPGPPGRFYQQMPGRRPGSPTCHPRTISSAQVLKCSTGVRSAQRLPLEPPAKAPATDSQGQHAEYRPGVPRRVFQPEQRVAVFSRSSSDSRESSSGCIVALIWPRSGSVVLLGWWSSRPAPAPADKW